jgi:hypothetical protein
VLALGLILSAAKQAEYKSNKFLESVSEHLEKNGHFILCWGNCKLA